MHYQACKKYNAFFSIENNLYEKSKHLIACLLTNDLAPYAAPELYPYEIDAPLRLH